MLLAARNAPEAGRHAPAPPRSPPSRGPSPGVGDPPGAPPLAPPPPLHRKKHLQEIKKAPAGTKKCTAGKKPSAAALAPQNQHPSQAGNPPDREKNTRRKTKKRRSISVGFSSVFVKKLIFVDFIMIFVNVRLIFRRFSWKFDVRSSSLIFVDKQSR